MVLKDDVEFTYKLKPFTTSGEYILIPSASYKKNESPFNEYLLVEFFAPIGANKFNGIYSYITKDGEQGIYKYPQFYGLKIYHVNAKIGYFSNGNNTPLLCTVDDENYESIIEGKTVGLDFAYSNTIRDSEVGKKPVLYHLLESSGKNTFKDSEPANNDTLFREGDDFGITKFVDFTFDDGSKANFKLKVKSISTKGATLEISSK
jgi:hypothetical protein